MRTQGPLFAVLAVSICASSAALATAQRTFVSATGVDANPCSISAPCRSFAAAIVQTTDGGDVVVLDSAGYGPVSIAINVAITAPPGVFAGVTVFSGTGVDVGTSGLKVVVRGLTITGIGGNVGVHVGAASDVTIERCDIASMLDYGIRADAPGAVVHLADTSVRRSATGISLNGAVVATLVRTSVHSNAGDGIDIFAGARVEIRDSDVVQNGNGISVQSATGGLTSATLDGVEVSQNGGDGLWLYSTNGVRATATLSRCTFADNGGRGARIESSGNAFGNWSHAAIADSQFLRNNIGVDFIQGGGLGTTNGVLSRNSFIAHATGIAIQVDASSFYVSGGGNVTDSFETYSAPISNASF